ncbi:LysR family transcriptional regulator [Bacillus sp. AK128]
MEIRQLITFKKIVDAGGFTRAAEQLGYAQSTITAHIQALEQELGAPLFDRIGKKVILTDVGKHFLLHATEMIQLYIKAKDITNLEDQPTGELRIGAPESLTVYRLPPVIQAYRKKYTKVQITFKSGTCWSLQEDLRKGELDVAFFIQSEFEDSDIYTEKLKDEPLAMILPLQHQLREQSLDSMELANNENILFTEQGSYRDYFEAFLRKKGVQTEAGMEFWSIEAIKQCVICGLGISLLPIVTVQEELRNKQLESIHWDDQLGSVATILAYHKNKWLSPAALNFINLVKEHARDWD